MWALKNPVCIEEYKIKTEVPLSDPFLLIHSSSEVTA